MTQLSYIPDSPHRSVKILRDWQPRETNASQDSINGNKGTAPSSLMQENVSELHTHIDLDKGDDSNLQTRVHDVLSARSTRFIFEQSGSESTQPSQPLPVVQRSITDTVDDTSNVVIFGETGVGKSSVINLICGEKRAHISSDALGCTFQHEKHIVEIRGIPCALWDTTGLDKGGKGTVPAEVAEANLKELIDKLACSGGVHLIIYCIRATRLPMALKHYYDLCYVTVCQKKAPFALVVTGLENQEEGMETWWTQNKAHLKHCGMKFDAHACVTTLDIDDLVIQGRRSDSQKCLYDLVVHYASRRPWKTESSPTPINGRISRGGSPIGKRTIIRRVILYDRMVGAASNMTSTCKLGQQQLEYKWVRVHAPQADVSTGPPGVLVFYTSPLSSDDISLDDDAALMKFYDVTGGKTCPVIVVMRGCHDNEVVQKCWDAILSRHENILVHCIADTDTREEFEAMVETLCKEHDEVETRSNFWQTLWKRSWFFFETPAR